MKNEKQIATLQKLIDPLENGGVKPYEALELLGGLSEPGQRIFQEAMTSIGNGLRRLKVLQDELRDMPTGEPK